MKIACILTAHRRAPVTLETVRMLKRQTVKPHIIMVGDSRVEAAIANRAGCEYIQYANVPLSSKWQAGVWRAGDYNPEAVMVMGSDHWFTPDWCETYLHYLDEYDVVGASEWYVMRLERRSIKVVHRSYKGPRSAEPIGMGRMYSRAAMRRMGWVLYPERKNRRVDGIAMRQAQNTGCTVGAINARGVLALTVKCSGWPMIHSWDDMHGNRNLTEYPDVKNPSVWLRDCFPGSPGALRRIRAKVYGK